MHKNFHQCYARIFPRRDDVIGGPFSLTLTSTTPFMHKDANVGLVLTGTPPGVYAAWLLIAAPGGAQHNDLLTESESEILRVLWFASQNFVRVPSGDKVRKRFYKKLAIPKYALAELQIVMRQMDSRLDYDMLFARRTMQRVCPATMRVFDSGAQHLWIAL